MLCARLSPEEQPISACLVNQAAPKASAAALCFVQQIAPCSIQGLFPVSILVTSGSALLPACVRYRFP